MFDPTGTIKKFAATMLVAAAVAFAVPTAFASDGPPDAIDRYNHPTGLAWDGPPDAIDRYREGQLLELAAVRTGWDGPPDAIDRYLGRTVTPAFAASAADGFAWEVFGLGAGATVGAALLLGAIGLGALARRRRSGSLSTS